MQATHYTDGTGIPTATGTPPALPTAERDLKLSLSATRAALTEALAALEFVAEYHAMQAQKGNPIASQLVNAVSDALNRARATLPALPNLSAANG